MIFELWTFETWMMRRIQSWEGLGKEHSVQRHSQKSRAYERNIFGLRNRKTSLWLNCSRWGRGKRTVCLYLKLSALDWSIITILWVKELTLWFTVILCLILVYSFGETDSQVYRVGVRCQSILFKNSNIQLLN